MKATSGRKTITIFLCVLLMMPIFRGVTLSEEPTGFTQVKVNSDAPRMADQINPAIDGNRIVWQDNRNGEWNIYMKDLTSGTESRISSATGQFYPAISGDKVVWSQYREGPPPYPGAHLYFSNIYMKNLSSGQVTQLSESASTQQYPAVSGNTVVWQDDRNGNDDIYLYDIDTGSETQITTSLDQQRYPSISGDMVVWADWRNSSIDIYSYEDSTGTEERVSYNMADQNYPAISGDKIAWQDSRNDSNIYAYDLTTSTEKRISTHTGQRRPRISGNIIVWEDSRNGNLDIYMYDLYSGTERQVTTNPHEQLNPQVSGNKVVWQDNRNGNWDIYMYDITTGTETQVNSNTSFIPANQYFPAIDGSRVVWQDDRDGYHHIYVKDIIAGVERRLSTSGATQQYPAISGDKVVWQDARDGGSIYMYDLSTSSERRIDGATRQYSPPTSPDIDGNKIVWQDYRTSNWLSDIYLYDLSTSMEKRLSAATQQYWESYYRYYSKPAISGNKVVWQKTGKDYWWSGNRVSGIVLRDLLTDTDTTIVETFDYYYYDFNKHRNPAISGNTVVWEQSSYYWWPQNADIYMYNISSRLESRLTTNEYEQTNPAISGDKIVWADWRGGVYWRDYMPLYYGIFAYDIPTAADTRLTTSQLQQYNPDVSGDTVVWQDYRNGDYDIYMGSLANYRPTADSITPTSGTTLPGVARSFTTIYSDGNSWQDIKEARLLFNTSRTSTGGMQVRYNQNTNKLYLRNDTNTAWLGGYAPGSSNTIENSYGTLNVTATSVSGSGNTLTIIWTLTFKDAFSGRRYNTYLYVKDDQGATNGGWKKKGTYGVNRPPTVGTITPSSGSSPAGAAQTFTTTYIDTDGWHRLGSGWEYNASEGWKNIWEARLRFTDPTTGATRIQVYYNQNTNKLYLRNDANTAWLGGYAPGSPNIIENSYGKLNVGATSVSGSGTTLTVNWGVTPKATMSGKTYNAYLYAKDDAYGSSGWKKKGTWGVL